jgi:hypothetical protein
MVRFNLNISWKNYGKYYYLNNIKLIFYSCKKLIV